MPKVRCRDCRNLSKTQTCPKRGINTKMKINKARLCDAWVLTSIKKLAKRVEPVEEPQDQPVVKTSIREILDENRKQTVDALAMGTFDKPEKNVEKKGFWRKLFRRGCE